MKKSYFPKIAVPVLILIGIFSGSVFADTPTEEPPGSELSPVFTTISVINEICLGSSTACGNEGYAIGVDANGKAVWVNTGWQESSSGPGYIYREVGNVGIGTDSPSEALDVVGNIKASGTVCDGDGNCIDTAAGIWTKGLLGKIYYDPSGLNARVGIGTSSPDHKLHIESGDGDPSVGFSTPEETWYIGVDNSDDDRLKIGTGNIIGLNTKLSAYSDGFSIWDVLNVYNELNLQSNVTLGNDVIINDDDNYGKGIFLEGANRPLITRGYSKFTGGDFNGVGRWGMYLEPRTLTIGIPDLSGREFRIVSYGEAGTHEDTYLITRDDGDTYIPNLDFGSLGNGTYRNTSSTTTLVTEGSTSSTSVSCDSNSILFSCEFEACEASDCSSHTSHVFAANSYSVGNTCYFRFKNTISSRRYARGIALCLEKS